MTKATELCAALRLGALALAAFALHPADGQSAPRKAPLWKTLPASVSGPIPETASSHPFLAADKAPVPLDLSKWGYEEQEFLVSGVANAYRYDARKALAVVGSGPYTNRIIIRRPVSPKQSNGKVIVELLNASDAVDLSFIWPNSFKYLMENGYTYVGITSKSVAANRLKQFDPVRYGKISWASPVPTAERCKEPGDQHLFPGWTTPADEDGLLWDMTTQAGALFKSNRADNPLRDLGKLKLYLTGHSQSGGYVGTYARDFQADARMPSGGPVFDGILQTGSSGLSQLTQCMPRLADNDPHVRMRTGIPFIRINTLTDFYNYSFYLMNFTHRRPDSDAPGDLFRGYEIAGAEHVTPALLSYSFPPEDGAKAGVKPMARAACTQTIPNDYPMGVAFDAAVENLDRWTRGVKPPHGAMIQVDHPGDPNAKNILDPRGNVVGGVRSTAIDVPTAAYFGKSDPRNCSGQGHKEPFSPQLLHALYPTHDAYVQAVTKRAAELVADRWLTKWDEKQVVRAAQGAKAPE